MYLEWAFCGGEVDVGSNPSLSPCFGGYLGLVSSGLSVRGVVEDIGAWEEPEGWKPANRGRDDGNKDTTTTGNENPTTQPETNTTVNPVSCPQPTDNTTENTSILVNELEVLLAKQCREDFETYVRVMGPRVLPGSHMVWGKHIGVISRKLQALKEGRLGLGGEVSPEPLSDPCRKMMIFLSPGSMKSVLCSILFPSWCMGVDPSWRVLGIGHGGEFAADVFGKPLRGVLKSDEYRKIFGFGLGKEMRATDRFETEAGGLYMCAGVGASIAGKRGNLGIMDDVVSEQTAYSKTERDRINKWYGGGFNSRLLPDAIQLIVNTRWHEEDLSGYLMERDEDWVVVSVPAILDEDGAAEIGGVVGESYWPEYWPVEKLKKMRDGDVLSRSEWNALYMQNPMPDDGSVITKEMIRWWDKEEVDELEYVLMSMDTAFSKSETADYSAYSVWGVRSETKANTDTKSPTDPVTPCKNVMVLLTAEKGRWDFRELCKKVEEARKEWKPDGILIEKKASGQSLIQEMRYRGLPVLEYLPDRDKVSRMHACVPLMDRVRFPRKKWAEDVVGGLMKFPRGAHDDVEDTVSMAILWLRDMDSGWYASGDDEDRTKRKIKSYWQQA